MKDLIKILTIGILFLQGFNSQGQNIDFIIEGILEDYLEEASEDVDYSELQDRLYDLYHHPVSLNGEEEELFRLFFLSTDQINDILAYRRKYFGFVSEYELKTIRSIDKNTLEKLLYFISVVPDDQRGKLKLGDIFSGRNRVILKNEQVLETQKGYKTPETEGVSHYLGNRQKLYARYGHQLGKSLSYGITMEKDPGEEFFTGSNKNGFDFYSAHFYLGNQKKIKSLAIGDYYASFGQGLVFSNTFSMSKGPDVLNIYRTGDYIRPYKSVNENIYLRGIATTVRLFQSDFTLFYSNKMIDGSGTDELFDNEEDVINSFYTSGYHRTESEIDRKNILNEQILGGHFERSFDHFRFGLTAINGFYDKTLVQSTKLYKRYDFNGNEFTNFGVNYTYTKNNYLLFGETGYDLNNLATLNGALINLSSNMQVGLIYRYFDKQYVAPYANSFRTNTRTQNEEGFYFAFNIQPFRNWQVRTYIDHFHFPWLRYLVDRPSYGREYLTEVSYNPDYQTRTYLRVKYQVREKNQPGNETTTNLITPYKRLNTRWHIGYHVSSQLEARTRIEYTWYEMETISEGILLYQDLIFTSSGKRLRLIGRYALFNTGDYDSRIYTYENDLLYSFSIPSFYGKGARYYFLIKYKTMVNLDFYFKIARTNYLDRDRISSGLSEIEGNNRTDLKVMLIYRF